MYEDFARIVAIALLGVFAEQLARWRHEQPTDAQRRELDRLEEQIERLRAGS